MGPPNTKFYSQRKTNQQKSRTAVTRKCGFISHRKTQMSKTIVAPQIDPKKIYKTPRGKAIWPKIVQPNFKFNAAGVYEIQMKFPPELEKPFLAEIEELCELAYEQTCKEKFKTQLPRENPPWNKLDSDGSRIVKFKLSAGGVVDGKTWENKPPRLFDAAANLIANPGPDFQIGNGSIVRVLFQIRPYFVQKVGVTFRLKAVQLIKLVEYDDAKYFGLANEDDDGQGYRYTAPGSAPDPGGAERPEPEVAPSVEIPVNVADLEAEDPFAPMSTPAVGGPITDDDIPF
jgi:hypothetical protein